MRTPRKSIRATVHFDDELIRALRLKAVVSGLTISDLVNRAAVVALADDTEDVQARRDRVGEPVVDFAGLVVSLCADGRL